MGSKTRAESGPATRSAGGVLEGAGSNEFSGGRHQQLPHHPAQLPDVMINIVSHFRTLICFNIFLTARKIKPIAISPLSKLFRVYRLNFPTLCLRSLS